MAYGQAAPDFHTVKTVEPIQNNRKAGLQYRIYVYIHVYIRYACKMTEEC